MLVVNRKNISLNYNRRESTTSVVGSLGVGSAYPIRIQTMANTDTNDIEASVAQAKRCFEAGAELVRFTTQGSREAESLREIRNRLQGYGPLVADVHFNPNVADLAAQYVCL